MLKTITFLEDTIGENPGKFGFGDGFLDVAPILVNNVYIVFNITHHVQNYLLTNLSIILIN